MPAPNVRTVPSARNVPLAVAIAKDGRPKYVIAAEAGFTPNVLSGLISGRQTATDGQILRLADTLGVTPESITPVHSGDLDGVA